MRGADVDLMAVLGRVYGYKFVATRMEKAIDWLRHKNGTSFGMIYKVIGDSEVSLNIKMSF